MALSIEGLWLVRGVSCGNSVESLEEEPVEDSPTAVAAFVHEIALQWEVCRQLVIFAVPNFDARLQHRVRSHSVTGSTPTLV